MKRLTLAVTTAGLLGLAIASETAAQQAREDFPREMTSPASCQEVDWNVNMLDNHPRLIDACQEVVLVDGESWARFDARFKQIERDGHVIFNVLDRRNRTVEEFKFMPAAGQVAFIGDRETPFRQLRTTDSISLYVPEGQYGFATQPGVPMEQVAVVEPQPESRPVVSERTVAQRTPRAALLPATASSLPWLALAGFLALFSGLILTLRRWL